MKELHGRKIAFPDAKDLAGLFALVEKPKGDPPILASWPSWEAGTWSDRARLTRCRLSGHLAITGKDGGYRWYHVQAKPEVVEWIGAHVLMCSGDTLTFQVVEGDDGQALVTIQHGQIIGSHYLAVIDAKSLPTG